MIDERAAAARLIEGSNVKKNPLHDDLHSKWHATRSLQPKSGGDYRFDAAASGGGPVT